MSMKNGEGTLSFEQAKKLADGWLHLSDERPLVAGAMLSEISSLTQKLSEATRRVEEAEASEQAAWVSDKYKARAESAERSNAELGAVVESWKKDLQRINELECKMSNAWAGGIGMADLTHLGELGRIARQALSLTPPAALAEHDAGIRSEERELCAKFVEEHTVANSAQGYRIVARDRKDIQGTELAKALRAGRGGGA